MCICVEAGEVCVQYVCAQSTHNPLTIHAQSTHLSHNRHWVYNDTSILRDKWGTPMVEDEADKKAATEHWRVRRVLRFTQPIQGPWQLQGPPKPLSSYPQGSKLLEWVIYRVSRQQYTYAQP